MKRILNRLLILSVMIVALVMLSLPAPAEAYNNFCWKCVRDCWNLSGSVYFQCRANGGSFEQCDAEADNYYRTCSALFCAGCPVPPNGVPQ